MNKSDAKKLVSSEVVTLGHIRIILRTVRPNNWELSDVNASLMKTDSLRIFQDAIATYKEVPDSHIMSNKRDGMVAANIIREFGSAGIAEILRERP